MTMRKKWLYVTFFLIEFVFGMYFTNYGFNQISLVHTITLKHFLIVGFGVLITLTALFGLMKIFRVEED
jgi:hypothetical protein